VSDASTKLFLEKMRAFEEEKTPKVLKLEIVENNFMESACDCSAKTVTAPIEEEIVDDIDIIVVNKWPMNSHTIISKAIFKTGSIVIVVILVLIIGAMVLGTLISK